MTITRIFIPLLGAVFSTLLTAGFAFGEEPPLDPAVFDFDKNGVIDSTEVSMYVASRDKVQPDVSGFFDRQLRFASVDYATLEDAMRQAMIDAAARGRVNIKSKLGDPPYSIDALRKNEGYTLPDPNVPTPPVITKKHPLLAGIFGLPMESEDGSKSRGPILLRKSKDDWDGKLNDVSGASVALNRNFLKDSKTLSTEGALIYPITRDQWTILPSAAWKLARIDSPPEDGVDPATAPPKDGESDELTFTLPVIYSKNGKHPTPWKRHNFEFSGYALTDSHFRGLVAGAQFSYTPYYSSEKLSVNTGYKGLFGSAIIGYRLRAIPALDFNHLYYESRYIKRADQGERFAAGATTEIGLKTSTGFPSLEFVFTHKFFQGLNGSADWSALLSGSLKLWFNPNAGISFDRQRGETPIAEKDVNSSTLGFEVKF